MPVSLNTRKNIQMAEKTVILENRLYNTMRWRAKALTTGLPDRKTLMYNFAHKRLFNLLKSIQKSIPVNNNANVNGVKGNNQFKRVIKSLCRS